MFDEGQTNTSPEPVEQQTDQSTVQEDWLVIGDRKYDKDAAVTKITHADQHISKLEQELAELRREKELLSAQQEALQAMSQAQTQSNPTPAVQNTTETGKDDGNDLESRVEQILRQRESQTVKQTNLNQSTEAAKAVYGEAYQSKLEELGKGLGMSKADIVELASSKPQAFKHLFGLNTSAPAPKPSATSTVTLPSSSDDNPIKSVAKTVLNSSSAKERTSAIAALLAQATKR